MKKYYHYFRADGKIYKSTSILKFDKWAEENNIKNWTVIQMLFKEAIEV